MLPDLILAEKFRTLLCRTWRSHGVAMGQVNSEKNVQCFEALLCLRHYHHHPPMVEMASETLDLCSEQVPIIAQNILSSLAGICWWKYTTGKKNVIGVKMEVAGSSETLLSMYRTTRRHIPKIVILKRNV
jgi:hypothetical protein